MAQLFEVCAQANIAFKANKDLYLVVIQKAYNAVQLAQLFEVFTKTDIAFNENKEFYLAVIENSCYTDELTQGFVNLTEANIAFRENKDLYSMLIEKACWADKLSQVFKILSEGGITFNENKDLYSMVHAGAFRAHKVSQGLEALVKANVSLLNNKILILEIIENMHSMDALFGILDTFNQIEVKSEHSPEYFNSHVLFTHAKLANTVFKEVSQAGYSLKSHKDFFNALLKLLSRKEVHYQTIINIINQACAYIKANPEIQEEALEAIIDCATTQHDFLTFGPLNKSSATTKIEALLEEICTPNLDLNNALIFKTPNDYILTLPDHPEINLSLLIKNVNFSQLMLSDTLVKKLGEKLEDIIKIKCKSRTSNPIVNLLPDAEQYAIKVYVGPGHYKNINRLFRAEALKEDYELCSDNTSNNILAYFIIGCLLNDATNKIPHLVDKQFEKKLLNKIAHHYNIEITQYINNYSKLDSLLQRSIQDKLIDQDNADALMSSTEKLLHFYPPKDSKLDRGELINEEEMKRRTANAWTFPSLTSFSASKEGIPYFHKKSEAVRTVLENAPYRYVISHREQEVLLPQGTQVLTTRQIDSTYFVSTVYRSPSLEPGNHYWSDLALSHAFEQYLNKPYALSNESIELRGFVIARPNHGLAHTYRVMLAIEYVVHYFAHHAKDAEFKLFCQSLTEGDLEWLRVAGAFRITGRESETSANENLDLYNNFRQTSSDHFVTFVNETAIDTPEDMKQRMQHIVRYMGNPHYESTINDHDNERERKIRNYYHRILSIAHKLDLSRCHSDKNYTRHMQSCRDLSEQSVRQEQALSEVIRYIIALNKAHGDRLICDIQPNDELFSVNTAYQDIFAEVSQSWKRLFEITDTVTRPKKILPFQFEDRPKLLFSQGKHKAEHGLEVGHESTAMRTQTSSNRIF